MPELRPGISKYGGFMTGTGGKGLFTANSFSNSGRLSPRLVQMLVNSANNGIAKGTWEGYVGVKKHLGECAKLTRVGMTFPMKKDQVLTFISYLFCKGLKATTVSQYLSAIRMMHMVQGHVVPELRPAIVKLVLKGKENWDEVQARGLPTRMPFTIKLMKLLRVVLLLDKARSEKQKAVIFATACLCFWGAFRVGEILSKKSRVVDNTSELLKNDIYFTSKRIKGKMVQILNVKLKSPKESRASTRGVIVEVFANDTELCPVKAYREYLVACGNISRSNAAMRDEDGWAYTHARLNADLKQLMGKYVHYGKLSGHSFRSGMASLLAQLGYSDDVIQATGRWNSEAFLRYIKLPRVTRINIAGCLASVM